MSSVNKVIIVGNLGRDPETRYMPSGDCITNLAVATTDKWKDKASGEQKAATEWHRISAFGKLAEIMGQYLKKGSQVYVEGSLRTRKWTDKDGAEKYSTEVVLQAFGGVLTMLDGPKGGDEQPSRSQEQVKPAKSPSRASDDLADEVPF